MGAMAISTLAGSLLIAERARRAVPAVAAAVHHGLHDSLLGDRHLVDPDAGGARRLAPRLQRFPLRYDPLYWGAVFPLGMYTVATWQMAHALDLPFLDVIPHVFVYLALIAWTVAFIGLAGTLWAGLRHRPALDL